jgi:hypothetical protein
MLRRLAAELGMRPRTLTIVLALTLLFIYLQEIHDSMEGFIDGFKKVWK